MPDARLRNLLNPRALHTIELLDQRRIDTGVIKRNLNQKHHPTLSSLIGDLVDEATRQYLAMNPGTRFEEKTQPEPVPQLS